MSRLRVLAGLWLGVGLLGCAPSSDPVPPNVLVYVIDTLRADALSVYGNPHVATPEVERFAQEGLVVERSLAPSSWTRSSLATLLTGLAPESHGVLGRIHAVDPALPLLQERFRAAGYATAAVLGNPNIGRSYGFERGFDAFFELFQEGPLPTADRVTAEARAWLAAAPRPFFLFVLAVDPHHPYTPPPEHDRYGDLPGADGVHSQWRRPYLGEVSYADQEFGALLETLRESGELDRTLVVLTSDHGEEFGEHGDLGHGETLYEEVLRVPLLLRYPPAIEAGTRLPGPVELADLHRTVQRLAGLPEVASEGVDFLAAPEAPRGPLIGHLQLDGHFYASITDPPWKLVLDVEEGEVELYDLASDPGERVDRASAEPERVAALRSALERERAERKAQRRARRGRPAPKVDETQLPEATRRSLEALGYLEPAAPAP